jgi:hypothetical protein
LITGFFGSAAPINCFIVALTLRTVSQDETARLEVNPIATREIGAEGTAPPKVGQLAYSHNSLRAGFRQGTDAGAPRAARTRCGRGGLATQPTPIPHPQVRYIFFGQPLLTLRAATAEFVVPLAIRRSESSDDAPILRPALAHAADATRRSSCPHGMSKLAKAVRAG